MNRSERIQMWFEHYSDDIYKFLVYYTRGRDVEDLVQEVFIKALKNMDAFEGRAQPKTWLLTIARNTAIDYLRKQRLRNWLPDTFLRKLQAPEKSPAELLDQSEEKNALYEALHTLKQSYRDVLILRGIKGLSVSETAAILGWSEPKVNVTLHRATKELRRKLKDQTKEMIGDAI